MDPFRSRADEWWDATGAFAQLHRMNPVRIGFVRDAVQSSGGRTGGGVNASGGNASRGGLAGKRALDIGCGGGLASESLTRLGCDVTGIDTSPEAIAVARDHAASEGLTIDYRCASSGDMVGDLVGDRGGEAVGEADRFDIVLALEIVEHLENVGDFLTDCRELLRPGGTLVVSTLNRTVQSYLGAIVAAENILGWVPRGPHSWQMFITPQELSEQLRERGFAMRRIAGMKLNPLANTWHLSQRSLGINYIAAATC